jgi:hypothetical protein
MAARARTVPARVETATPSAVRSIRSAEREGLLGDRARRRIRAGRTCLRQPARPEVCLLHPGRDREDGGSGANGAGPRRDGDAVGRQVDPLDGEAAASLPLGRNEKVFLEIGRDAAFEPAAHAYGNLRDPAADTSLPNRATN